MTDRTPIIAPGTLPGRARATRKAHDRRTRLARESRAASPAGRARPETASRDEYRVLRSKPSNISLTPQSTRLDLPLVPPRQRPGHAQQHIHRQRRLTEDPPYQIRQTWASQCRRRCGRLAGPPSGPALPRLRESPRCLPAARSAATCKHSCLSLAWRSAHRAPRRGRCGRGVAFAATVGAPFTEGQAQARVRISTALTPRRSGAAEGVGDGRRPAPVQIDDSGRRGPFSGL